MSRNHRNKSDKYMVKSNSKKVTLFTTFHQTDLSVDEVFDLIEELLSAVQEHSMMKTYHEARLAQNTCTNNNPVLAVMSKDE